MDTTEIITMLIFEMLDDTEEEELLSSERYKDTHHYRCLQPLQLTPSLFILAGKPSRRWFHRFYESGFGLQF